MQTPILEEITMRRYTIQYIGLYAAMGLVIALSGCAPSSAAPFVIPTAASSPAATARPASTVAPVSGSGIRGMVTIGPTCPGPARPGQACTQPYAAVLVITKRDGTEVARVTSGDDGKFSIDLPPGDYTIVPKNESGSRLPVAGPTEGSVPSGRFFEVGIQFYTGIR